MRGNLLFGSAAAFRRDPLELFKQAFDDHGDVVRLRFGPKLVHLLAHPSHVKYVLQDNPGNFSKASYDTLEKGIGEGLISSEGDLWRRQRRMIEPIFRRERIEAMAETMVGATKEMLGEWHTHANDRSNIPLDVPREMRRLAVRIISRALFTTDISPTQADEFGKALEAGFRYGTDRFGKFFALPERVPTPANLRYLRAIRTVDTIIYSMIEERLRVGLQTEDLLSRLLQIRHKGTERAISKKQIRDEMLTMLAAGHATTALGLSWIWYLMDRNPDQANILRDEVDRVIGDRTPALEDLPRLSYVRRFVEESLRLFPPAPGWALKLEEADEISGFAIPKGSHIVLSPYVTHRHPDFWDNPDRFDPDRFLPSRAADRPRYAYFPFSGGPRSCLGKNFAMLEMQLIVAMVSQSFELSVVHNHPIEPEAIATLQFQYGLPMNLEKIRPKRLRSEQDR